MQVALWSAVVMLVVVIIAWIDAVTGVGTWARNVIINIRTTWRIKMKRDVNYDGRHRA